MAKTYYYVLLTNKGQMITTDHKLPFYWNREVARKDAIRFNGNVRQIKISDVKELLHTIKPKGILLKPWM